MNELNDKTGLHAKPRPTFSVALPKDAAPNGMVTLVAFERCNMHGLWESIPDVTVV